jgi:hypothetical protein
MFAICPSLLQNPPKCLEGISFIMLLKQAPMSWHVSICFQMLPSTLEGYVGVCQSRVIHLELITAVELMREAQVFLIGFW